MAQQQIPPRWARAFAPATVGNVACGFDVLGLAIGHPGDHVTVAVAPGEGIHLHATRGDEGRLPTDPTKNTASVAARAVLARAACAARLSILVEKGLPLSSGLGGSAASAVAGALAADAALGAGLSSQDLLACSLEGERVASGSVHPDNAAPALMGGIVLVPTGAPLRIVELPVPEELAVAVIHPHLEIETLTARQVLGDTISLRAGVAQWGNTAGLVAGLYEEDWELIARCLVDHVAEPVRAALVPGFGEAREAAMGAGALGFSLSGSGPSVFALCRGEHIARRVGDAVRQTFLDVGGVDADTFVSRVGGGGARIAEQGEGVPWPS